MRSERHSRGVSWSGVSWFGEKVLDHPQSASRFHVCGAHRQEAVACENRELSFLVVAQDGAWARVRTPAYTPDSAVHFDGQVLPRPSEVELEPAAFPELEVSDRWCDAGEVQLRCELALGL